MIKSPCLTCPRRGKDKRDPECVNCTKRLSYVASLGDMTASVPVEMGDMTASIRAMEEMMETKICSNPGCDHAGQHQPIDAFGTHPRFKTVMHQCKACVAKARSAGGKKRKKADVVKLPFRKHEMPETGFRITEAAFGGYPDLLEKLEQIAERECRTPAEQLRWMVKTYQSPVTA